MFSLFQVLGWNALKLHLVLILENAHGKICVCFVAYSVLKTLTGSGTE